MTHVLRTGHSILVVPECFILVEKSERQRRVLYYSLGNVADFRNECAKFTHLLCGGGLTFETVFEIIILSGQLVKLSPRVLHFMLLPAGFGETVPKIS